jgi:hypothetical protein
VKLSKRYDWLFFGLIISILVRVAFDPSLFRTQLSLDVFEQEIRQNNTDRQIQLIRMQYGLTNFWGQPIVLLSMIEKPQERFVILPRSGLETLSENPFINNVRLAAVTDLTSPVEIVVAISISAATLLLYRKFY